MRAHSLMYHDVVAAGREADSGFPDGDAARYKLEAGQFREHLRAVTAAVAGAGLDRPVTAEDLLWAPWGRVAALLHFDDGGASAPAIADELEREGWRGWFHVTTGRIGTRGFVARSDVRSLAERGHVVGSHSCTHPPRISALSPGEIEREWRDSLAVLSDITGAAVVAASVPGGYTSRRVVEAADRAGVRVLFTSEPVSTYDWYRGCLVLGRYAVVRSTPAGAAAAMATGARGPRWRQWALWNAKKAAKRVGGESWLALRKALLSRQDPRA